MWRVERLEERLLPRGQLIVKVAPNQNDGKAIAGEAAKLGRPVDSFEQMAIVRRGLGELA